ncbi:MAG: hypothetical protein HGB14_11350, partial [Anaerolineaceae bacterium]|nr:hypothetical protein [Anaerolineaceae bacterium]
PAAQASALYHASEPSPAQFEDVRQWALDKGMLSEIVSYHVCVNDTFLP